MRSEEAVSEKNDGSRSQEPAGKRFRRVLRKAAVGLGAFYALWLLGFCLLQRCFVFPRHMAKTVLLSDDSGIVKLWIPTSQGKVEAWFAPVEDRSQKEGQGVKKPAVIYAHGNAELIDGQTGIIRGYRRMGVAVLLCEFRGYGRSAGSPSQKRIVKDFVRCHDWLVRQPTVDRSRVLFHGRSIGTGVVCALARKRTPAAMILTSPFTSLRSLMARYLIPGFMVRDPFDNLSALKEYRGPVLILHGKNDAIVPIRHGREAARVSRNKTLIEYDLGHNDLVPSPRYWSDMKRFLFRHGILREQGRKER